MSQQPNSSRTPFVMYLTRVTARLSKILAEPVPDVLRYNLTHSEHMCCYG